jgi:hypothetical protein
MQMDKVLELQAVLLRNHPQMSYKGVPSWPPRWIWLEGPEDKHPNALGCFGSSAHQSIPCIALLRVARFPRIGLVMHDPFFMPPC